MDGLVPLSGERNEEIGARFKRWRLQTVGEYVNEMRECWSEIDRVLRPGAYCAVVLGELRRFPGTGRANADRSFEADEQGLGACNAQSIQASSFGSRGQ